MRMGMGMGMLRILHSQKAEVGNAYPLAAFSQVKLVKLGTKAVLISKLKRLSFTSNFTTYI